MSETSEANKDLIRRLLAEVDRGSHRGELFGHPATGKTVTMTSITIYRIVNGRIAERWSEQGAGLLEQLGISASMEEVE